MNINWYDINRNPNYSYCHFFEMFIHVVCTILKNFMSDTGNNETLADENKGRACYHATPKEQVFGNVLPARISQAKKTLI